MEHIVTKQSALDELIRQGIAKPTWQLAPRSLSYSCHGVWEDSDYDDDDDDDDDDDQDMRPVLWNEPMCGRNPQDKYSGFSADWVNRKFHDHAMTLYEVNVSDGIEVCQARAIFSNPYSWAVANGVDHNTLQRMQTFGMELWVSVDANLNWYSPGGNDVATCIYKELNPMPYETFKKTFRYFLLRHTIPPTATQSARLKANVLPTTATQPMAYFFDQLADTSEISVRRGLNNETADQAWAQMPGQEYIERATFNQLWALYRRGRILWQMVRRFWTMRCVAYYWASLAARPDTAGNAPPGAIDAFHQEF